MNPESEELTLSRVSALIRARKLSPVELVKTLISRIETYDSQLHAFITLTPDIALRQARHAEAEISQGRWIGPLHGVPFGLKDIYDTAGVRTTASSKIFANRIPKEDAPTVAKLYAAGGVLLGKLATHEFAIGGPSHDLPWPVPRNPWNTEHYVGGSSSGPAAAIAAGFLPAALGSDTGASIRNPAALAGIAGMKPTFGLISRRRVLPNAYAFDTCGPMARTTEDCAILLQLLAGYDAADPASVCTALPDYSAALTGDVRGLRIGVIRHFWEEDAPVGEELAQAMDEAIRTLMRLGVHCEDVSLRSLRDYHDVRMIVGQSELFSNHHANLAVRMQDFGSEFLRKVLPAMLWTSIDYVQAQRERRRMLDEMRPIYARFDALLSAGAGPAVRLDCYDGEAFWSKPNIYNLFNITGGPALAVCNGFSASGLPLGMQIGSAPFRDEVVLRIGDAYEKATKWHLRRPQLEAGAVSPVVVSRSAPRPSLDGTMNAALDRAARRAGLELDERSWAMLASVAQYALAMPDRLPRLHASDLEPAAVFRFPH